MHVDGPGGELWQEQGGSALEARLGFSFREPALRRHLAGIVGFQALDPQRDQLWINRYRPGKRVPIHRDREGNTQLLICLQGLRHSTSRIGGACLHRSGYSRVVLVLRLFGGDPGYTAVPARPASESA